MKTKQKVFGLIVLLLFGWTLQQGFGQRLMENLGRGTVAVRSSSNEVFISWRILGLEFNAGVTYNLYRGNTLIASNQSVSNYVDNTSSNSTYSVAAVVGGSEQPRSPAVGVTTYTHGSNTLPAVRVPVQHTSGYVINHVHVGDLDGGGEYDFVLVKKQYEYQQLLEAYKRDGTCSVSGTGGWQNWVTRSCTVSGGSGIHDLYFRFTGGSGNLFNFNWWKFSEGETPVPTPALTPTPGGTLGDVNGNDTVDIVDALLVAQYYVGLDPANFNIDAADTNCDSSVDIVDALLIAQYYVGLVTEFC